jgi:hypothetical protein
MCKTNVTWLPTVRDGKVQEIKNVQWMVGETSWTKRGHAGERVWTPTSDTLYNLLGGTYESWVDIKDGDVMVYDTMTSMSPLISQMTWRDGKWVAWVHTGHCGRGHWSDLIIGPTATTVAVCNNGLFCPDAYV